MTNGHQLWFKTDKFEIVEGEDSETNPRRFGRQFAEWLRGILISKGYPVEEVIAEDWGWCVMCSRKPFMLWVGCGNVQDYETTKPSDPIPKGSDVTWTCYVTAEPPILARLFKRVDTTSAVEKLFEQVRSALLEDSRIALVEEP